MFSKRHYEWLARFWNSEQIALGADLDGLDDWTGVVLSMADKLELDNPRFNRAKFLKACGMEPVT